VPDVRPDRKLIGVACSDLHLTDVVPKNRILTSTAWHQYVTDLVYETYNTIVYSHKVQEHELPPLYIAGDIFDKPIVSPSVLNQFMRMVERLCGKIIMIKGQHDMIEHSSGGDSEEITSYDLTSRWMSTIYANRRQRVIISKSPARKEFDSIGFNWGELSSESKIELCDGDVALIHQYLDHPNSPVEMTINGRINIHYIYKIFKGYKFVIVGDHHRPFVQKHKNGPTVINCGGITPRTIAEKNQDKFMYALYDDGSYKQYLIDDYDIKWRDVEVKEDITIEIPNNVSEFTASAKTLLSPMEAIKCTLANQNKEVLKLFEEIIRDIK